MIDQNKKHKKSTNEKTVSLHQYTFDEAIIKMLKADANEYEKELAKVKSNKSK